MSCLVPVEKSSEVCKLTASMAKPLAELQVGGVWGSGGCSSSMAKTLAELQVGGSVGVGWL